MLIFDEQSNSVMLAELTDPLLLSHTWVLDLVLRDFVLSPVQVIEEVSGPAMLIDVGGYEFLLPTAWHILVMDSETGILDTATVGELSATPLDVFTYGPSVSRPSAVRIRTVGYVPASTHVYPAVPKHAMLCIPISPTSWICASSTDPYHRHIRNMLVGDII